MKQFALLLCAVLTGAFLITSCTDPSVIGSELLEDDRAQLTFTDTLSIEASTVTGRPLITHRQFSSLNGYLCGQMEDPVFGTSTASVYVQALPEFTDPIRENLSSIDSVVLVLQYDTFGVYGAVNEPFSLEIFRLIENMPKGDDYRSDTSFSVFLAPLGQKTFIPNFDSTSVLDYSNQVPTTISFPHLRIPLSNSLGEEILGFQDQYFQEDSLFLDAFKGIKISPSQPTQGMLSLDIFPSRSGIYIYYKQDTVNRQLHLEFNSSSTKFVSFEHDYNGAPVNNFVQNGSDSLLFIQGMAGLETRITFPHLDQIRGAVVNKAELEISIGTLIGDLPVFDPPRRITLSYFDAEGNFIPISDFLFGADDLDLKFGGVLLDQGDNNPAIYRCNMGTHFQEILDGTVPNELYIIVYPKIERAERAIFYGPGHSLHPMRLRLSVTDL